MVQNSTKRTGYTITGFSEAGFGCCGHYKLCDIGKSTCIYEVTDPEVKNCCAAYLRNHEPIEFDVDVTKTEDEQLSLF